MNNQGQSRTCALIFMHIPSELSLMKRPELVTILISIHPFNSLKWSVAPVVSFYKLLCLSVIYVLQKTKKSGWWKFELFHFFCAFAIKSRYFSGATFGNVELY